MIITEYALPRPTIAPHDVRPDAQGFVWYSNFVEPYLGRLDPRTGAHSEFRYELPKPTFPAGALALEPDQDGNWWLSMMFQSGLVRFDTKTTQFRHFPIPPELMTDATQQSLVMPGRAHVDGKVWTNDVDTHTILRLDLASGAYERIDPFRSMPKGRQHSPYGLAADPANNLYFMDFGDESVGRVDAKTLRTTLYPTPTPRFAPAPHHAGPDGPAVVRGIRRQQGGDVRYRQGKLHGVGRRPRRILIPTTSFSTTTANCGAARCRATACCASIP